MNSTDCHHHVATVLVDNLVEQLHVDGEPANVVHPTRLLKLITVNGEIWQKVVLGYNQPRLAQVVADWDSEWSQGKEAVKWCKIHPADLELEQE